MKLSSYNIFIPYEDEHVILYNSLNKSVLLIGQELKQALEKNDIALIPRELRTKLYENGALVDNDADELRILKVKYWNDMEFSMLQDVLSGLRNWLAEALKGRLNME